jgi:CubicO group peptidase (beta-lactamase class C family)
MLARALAAALALSAAAMPVCAQQTPPAPAQPHPAPVHAGAKAAPAGLDLAAFDAWVRQAVRDWNVPGLAVAIVRGDSVVFEKGYGTRHVGRDEPVDAHTLFAIGSTTKAFTVTTLLMLADSGKVDLDAPVRTYLPAFELRDPWVTRELTVRDLLTHRSGVAADDFLWLLDYPRGEIVRRMRFLPQATSPRSQYAYNNLSFIVAGEVTAAASGMPWERLVQTRILRPLGMAETVTGVAGLAGRANVAAAHVRRGDTLIAIPELDIDNAGPAGSIHSSVHDMARWLRFQLDSTRLGGRRFVSPERFAEMYAPQFVVPVAGFYPSARLAGTRFVAYGLGWFLEDYRGHFVAMHTGSIDGMSAITGMLPEERVGVVVLANVDHAEVRHAILNHVLDLYTGEAPRDWSGELRALYAAADSGAKARLAARLAQRVRGTRPTLPLERYAGVYTDSLYGDMRVAMEGGHLVLRIGPRLVGDMEHWSWDTFRVLLRNPMDDGSTFLTFALAPDGTVSTATIEGQEPFQRAAGPSPPTP